MSNEFEDNEEWNDEHLTAEERAKKRKDADKLKEQTGGAKCENEL
jgi:hypothetical protein